jgi:hypothetical protein
MTSGDSLALDARLKAREPDIAAMCARLPDLGESLNNAAVDLSRDITVERVDEMLVWLKGAESSLVHLRRALAEDSRP